MAYVIANAVSSVAAAILPFIASLFGVSDSMKEAIHDLTEDAATSAGKSVGDTLAEGLEPLVEEADAVATSGGEYFGTINGAIEGVLHELWTVFYVFVEGFGLVTLAVIFGLVALGVSFFSSDSAARVFATEAAKSVF